MLLSILWIYHLVAFLSLLSVCCAQFAPVSCRRSASNNLAWMIQSSSVIFKLSSKLCIFNSKLHIGVNRTYGETLLELNLCCVGAWWTSRRDLIAYYFNTLYYEINIYITYIVNQNTENTFKLNLHFVNVLDS